MKNAKRLAALFLTAAVLLTAGCSRKTVTSQNSVWFIAKSTNTEFWKSAFAGANAAKSEYNVDLTICGPETEEDYEEQNRLIDEAVAAGADAIVYSAISYTKNAEAITRAAKQGLKIAVIDSDVDSDGVGVRIGTDNVEAGRMAGRAALQTDWDSLTVGIVNFDLGSRNGQERESGFREALAGDPRVKDIYTINVNADATTAQVRTVQLLVEHPEINVIVGFNEPIAVGAAMAVHSLGLAAACAWSALIRTSSASTCCRAGPFRPSSCRIPMPWATSGSRLCAICSTGRPTARRSCSTRRRAP